MLVFHKRSEKMKRTLACTFLILSVLISFLVGNNVLANSKIKNCSPKQKSPPKISVIIPVYNAEAYLKDCLDSVVNQTLEEIEIICINDASPDNSLKILRKYEKKDKRIVVIDKKENEGANSARNAGLNIAKGEYIAFLDSDDYLDLNAYEIALKEAEDKDLDILSFGWESFPTESNWDKYKSSPRQKYFENSSIDAWFYCGTGSNVNIWNKLYKRSFLINSQIHFKTDLKCAQDYYFNMRIFPRAKKIEFIPDRIYNYRRDSAGSISSRNKGYVRMQSHLKVIDSVLEDWNKNGFLIGSEKKVLTLFVNWNISVITSIENISEKSVVAQRFLNLLRPVIDKTKDDLEKNILDKINLIGQFIIKEV